MYYFILLYFYFNFCIFLCFFIIILYGETKCNLDHVPKYYVHSNLLKSTLWTLQAGMTFHFDRKFCFLFVLDFVSVILTEMKFQTGMTVFLTRPLFNTWPSLFFIQPLSTLHQRLHKINAKLYISRRSFFQKQPREAFYKKKLFLKILKYSQESTCVGTCF